jgi:hypothetical protein
MRKRKRKRKKKWKRKRKRKRKRNRKRKRKRKRKRTKKIRDEEGGRKRRGEHIPSQALPTRVYPVKQLHWVVLPSSNLALEIQAQVRAPGPS